MIQVKEFQDIIKNGMLKELATSQCNDFIKQTKCSIIDIKYQVINIQDDYLTGLLLIYSNDDDYNLGGCEEDITGKFLKGVINNANNYLS